jgi:signal transduction histidine kinase/CheY-like chemotaxis protein
MAVICVSALSWLTLQRVDVRLQELHRQSLTRVAEAIALSKQSSDLVASAPFLLSQRSNYLINEEGAKLLSVLTEVRDNWPSASVDADGLPESGVVEITRRMEAGIRDLMSAAEALDDMQARLRGQIAQLSNLRDRASRAIQAQIVPDETVFAWWTLRSMNADALNAAYASNLIGVGEEQRYFQQQRNQIDRFSLTAGQDEFLRELDAIVTGPDGLFEQRRQELSLQLQAQNALFRIRRDADGINAEASELAARAEEILTTERGASSTMIQFTRISVAAISLASLALALLAAAFVSRYVALNISRISGAMVRLANGERTSMLPRRMGGDDEIGDLFRSYRVFRANALRLDRSNRQLDRRNALFEKVFANITDGVVITDAAGQITASNPAFHRIFRTEWGRFPHVPFVEWLRTERFGLSAVSEDLKVTHRGFVDLKSDDGQIIELRSSGLPEDGRVWLIADVTERRKLSERIEQIDRIETLGKVAGDTAHDFANVLSTIRTHAHLLQKAAPAPLSAHVAAIENAVDFGASLSDRLLAFSRKQRLAPEVVELNRLVEGLIDLAEIGLKEGVRLHVTYSDEPLEVRVDPGQLESSLLNLILNANNAIEAEGTISLELFRTAAGDAEILVSDDGCGMSSDVRLRAIEPFFTTRAKEGGTGLGLSIVYGFIMQSGGDFDIDSEEGRYTRVKISLPQVKTPKYLGKPGTAKQALIIDDNPSDLALAVSVCKALGFESKGVRSPAEARKAVQVGKFDMVLSDLDLGGFGSDGVSLLRWTKQTFPDSNCILMSGRSDGGTISSEEFRFVAKPLSLESLKHTLNAD